MQTVDHIRLSADERELIILDQTQLPNRQVYLSLRLAACEVVLPQDDPCPIVLDDALVSFDDTRAGLALDHLKETARDRQILLFTCQGREAAHFAGDPEVNVIRWTDGL